LISVGKADAGMPTANTAAAPSLTRVELTVIAPRSSSGGGGGPGGPGGGGGGGPVPSSTIALGAAPMAMVAQIQGAQS